MSRICVKNLPKYVAEDRLRDFFSQKGEVTDVKLMRTKDGKSRQFGFVGFRSEREAEEALKYFNKSFLDSTRITCEIAHKVGDPNMPRPWSKSSLQKLESFRKDGKKAVDGKTQGLANSQSLIKNQMITENEDPQLQEFLEVMQSRNNSKLWGNDTSTAHPNEKSVSKQISVQGEDKKKSALMLADDEIDERVKTSVDGEGKENRHNDEVISDMDYFRSRVKKQWSDSESDDNDSDIEDEGIGNGNDFFDGNINKNKKSVDEGEVRDTTENEEADIASSKETDDGMTGLCNQLPQSKDENKEVFEDCRLFVRNLPYTTTEDELELHFSKFGSVSQVHLVVDKGTKRSKGIAFVLYSLPESTARALGELDNTIFQGRLLHIMRAKQKNPAPKEETDFSTNQSSKTFKQQRVEERKASEAAGNTRAWNSLFMRPDTVIEHVARKYGISKSDLLDREADDIAVRVALGETQVIADTKKSLANAAVNIASLEDFAAGKMDGVKRSNHVILVKNLPYGASEGELSGLFGKFGSLDKIVLPSTKTLALVIFLEPGEARAAFKGLAYKRYKDAPLYLEWAPANILSPNPISVVDTNNTAIGEKVVQRALLEQQVEGLFGPDVDPDRLESRSLFIKNLNFKTSDENLKKHFSEHMKEGKILSVRVKKHLKNGKYVSMGFGFVEFDSVDTATNICKDLQGTVLDGHALILQLCHAKKDAQIIKNAGKDKSSTKLIVRNVAFEATEKDLRQLFSPFGQLKSLRLPVRIGKHRGFAFVEYMTKQEAQNALQALSNTHLYGRHLVLERAKEGESLEELRARTAARFTEQDGFQNSSKVSKKRKQIAILDDGSL